MNSTRGQFCKAYNELVRTAKEMGITRQLLKNGIGNVFVRVASRVLALVLSIILARTLEPKGYGTYAYVLTVFSIVAVSAQFGLPTLLIRETAKAHVRKRWGILRGLWRWMIIVGGGLSLGIVSIVFAIFYFFVDSSSLIPIAMLVWGFLFVPISVLCRLYGASLQGLRLIVLGRLPEDVIRPGLFVVFLLIVILWVNGEWLTPSRAMGFHTLTTGIALIFAVIFLHRNSLKNLEKKAAPIYEHKAWLISCFPIALTAGAQLINQSAGTVMLGIFQTAEDVGVYRIALQGGMLVVFGLETVNMVVAPYFARMHAQQDDEALQKLVKLSTRSMFLLAFPVVIVFIVYGKEMLVFFTGKAYIEAYVPLVILSIGQLINSYFGPVGYLLNMTGHERYTAWGVSISTSCNLILNLVLIPAYGIIGAAIATAVTQAIWNILLWAFVRQRLGIDSMAIQLFKEA